MYSLGVFSVREAVILAAVVLIVGIISLVCYVLYYDLPYVKGFIDGAVRFYPHNSVGEGQFMCAIKKNEETSESMKKGKFIKLESKELKLVSEFLNDTVENLDLNLIKKYQFLLKFSPKNIKYL